MSIRLVCPACQHPHLVSEARLESTIRCKHCGKTIPVSAGQTSAADDEEVFEDDESSDQDEEPEVVFPSDDVPRARPRAAAKRGPGRIVLVIVGLAVAGAISIALCCGGLAHFGFEAMTEEVRVQLEADHRFTEHVGQIQKLNVELLASVVDDDEGLWIYHVTGTKWSGRINVQQKTDADGNEQIIWVRYTLATGEKVELQWPDPGAAAVEPKHD